MHGHPSTRPERLVNGSETELDLLFGGRCQIDHWQVHLVEAARSPKQTAVGFAQANFFSVPKLGEENRWLHGSLLKKSTNAARPVLMPGLCWM